MGSIAPGSIVTTRGPASRWAAPTGDVGDEYRLRRAAEDAALEPWALLKAVRDSGGRVVDFVYHDINRVAARQQRLLREDLLGRSLIDSLPELARSGILEKYVHCIDTGEPLFLDDLAYFGRTLDGPDLETHLYEMRGVRVETEYLSLNWRDVNQQSVANEHLRQARAMLRAAADAMLDPQVLLEGVRDSSGKIVDFAYREVNNATCDYLGLAREDLLGRGVVETMPGIETSLLAGYIRCLDTGEPMVLNDFSYDNEILLDTRRYDLRATRAAPNSITVTWRDVTDRFQGVKRLAESEERFRLLAENVGDVVCRMSDDGTFLWVSTAVQEALGAPPQHYIGRKVWDNFFWPEDRSAYETTMKRFASGEPYLGRTRFLGADGTPHWVHLFLKPYIDHGGQRDGMLATFRVIDDEVAAEQQVEEARLLQAQADARYRQLIETSSVGTALSNLDGSVAVVNQAMCDLAGIDMDTALRMSWMQAIPEPHLQTLHGAVDDLLAGRIQSYRGEHVFIHADGRPRWMDVSLSVMRKQDGQPEYVIFQSVDITAEVQAREQLESARVLLAASADSMLDAQVLLEAVRDRAGQVIDFRYVTVNAATCSYLGLQESDLVSHTQLEASPNLEGSELQRRYIRCLEDGEPVIIDDYSFFNEIIDDDRRYDIRATRAGADLISLTWRDVTDRFKAAQRALEAQTLLHATVDSMLNPQMLLEAVRDHDGQVVDFVYRSANLAFCSYRGWEEQKIIGQSLLEAQPSLRILGLIARYVHCVDTGESVVLDDFEMFNAVLGETRRFDIRVVRAGADLISLTFSDVTERSHAAERISASERSYRLLAENSSDMVTHVRDGRFVWTSPSVKDVVGGSPEYWIGRHVREIIPDEDESAFADRLATLTAGGTVQQRIRVVAVDGVTHWVDLHGRPLIDDDGHPDGFTAALRLVDAEVAAQQRVEDALRRQARADALYRRSVDNSAVGMCLADLEGNFIEANHALCEFFGYDAQTLKRITWQQLTDPEYLEADLDNRAQVLAGDIESYRMVKRFIHACGHAIWGDLSVSCIRDAGGQVEMFIGQITDVTATVEATQQYKLLAENAGDLVIHIRDGRFAWVSPSCTDVIGGSPDYWVGRDAGEIVAPVEGDLHIGLTEVVESGGVVQARHRVQALDGTIHWVDAHAKPFYAPDGRVDGITAALRVVDDEVAAEQRAEEARRLQAKADARYRLSMDTAAIGMCLTNAGGAFLEVNPAMCELFGYDAESLLRKTWQDLTAPESVGLADEEIREMFRGLRESYRVVGQLLHADGHRIWADVAVSCIRDGNGQVENLAGQITDITVEVQAREQLAVSDAENRLLAERLGQQSQRMADELASAANYMASIMPKGLTGEVRVTSCYLPSRELGGDCFDYTWIDDDHLLVYLIDVSGHGLEPALLSVSVHNMIRSGSLGAETLLAPEVLLTALNSLFQMEQQGEHYFTIWCGVYQASTRTLRYANAGSPPPFAFSSAEDGTVSATELSVASTPIGMFEDSEFTAHTYPVPTGCRILVYSDGASEISLADDHQLKPTDFKKLIARVASSPDWTLDGLIAKLNALSPSGAFEDDFSLIRLDFD